MSYVQFLEKLRQIRVRRPRRRPSPVPIREWIAAFAVFQKATAYAIDQTRRELAGTGVVEPPMFGILFRIAAARYGLPKLHRILAENPGIEPPKALVEAVDEVLRNIVREDVLMELIPRIYGVKPGTPQYNELVEKVRKYLEKAGPLLKKYVEQFVRMLMGETGTSGTRAAGGPPMAAG